MVYYLQSHFLYTWCFVLCVCASLANLYARANFYTHNYVNRICPEGETSQRGGVEQIKSCFESIGGFFFLLAGVDSVALTGGVVSDAVEHLRAGS